MFEYVPFESLKGEVFVNIEIHRVNGHHGDEIHFYTDSKHYVMRHEQDCCETVTIEEIAGNLDKLLNNPILVADVSSEGAFEEQHGYIHETWTFYKLATVKGWVDIRWYGTSNGSYSEKAYLYECLGENE